MFVDYLIMSEGRPPIFASGGYGLRAIAGAGGQAGAAGALAPASGGGSGGSGRLSEPFALQDVVSRRVPSEDDGGLGATAHSELCEAPLPEPRIDAFVDRALAIGCLTGLALHPLAPRFHAGSIILARREGVGIVLIGDRRAMDRDAGAMRPFDVVILAKAAIGQMLLGEIAVSGLDPLQHRPQQAAIRAAGGNIDPHHDLLSSNARDLHVVGGPKPTIGHLHHTRVGIGGGDAGRLRLLATWRDVGGIARRRSRRIGGGRSAVRLALARARLQLGNLGGRLLEPRQPFGRPLLAPFAQPLLV